jgi:molybdate/tungstate transport system permease protein
VALLLELLRHTFRRGHESFVGWSFVLGFVLLGGVLLPIFYLVLQSSPQTLAVTAGDPEVRAALSVSLLTATITTGVVLVFGVPLAYAMARTRFWGRQVLDSLIDLPILIPQTVAGVALLVMVGPKTPIGQFLKESFGLGITSTLFGIVVAQVFVSASFLVRASINAFQDVDPRLERVSRTLGASQVDTFLSISLPLAWRGIFAGCILTWSRAISEAGALMLLAYHPFTISILVHDRFTQYGTAEAQPVAVLLVIVCLFLFLVMNLIRYVPVGPWTADRRPHA